MQKDRIQYLYKQYLLRRLSPTELEEFRKAVACDQFEKVIGTQLDLQWDRLDQDVIDQAPTAHMDAIYKRLQLQISRRPHFIRRIMSYAAVLAILLTVGLLIFKLQNPHNLSFSEELSPGSNIATLKTSDGRTISLRADQEGIVVGDAVTYQDGTLLENLSPVSYQLDVPFGGQYQVTLPDGSQVWLNAGSSLSYPAKFDRGERVVELTGEAYFKVKKQNDHARFLVKTPTETVEVLGTEFNISAYSDDVNSHTTLVTGSVEVSSSVNQLADSEVRVRLQPGEQAWVGPNAIQVHDVNVQDFIAWREGSFRFNETPLEDIMKQIARWYEVEIEFLDDDLRREAFTGVFARRQNASHILSGLQKTGDVKFTVKGKKIIISQK